MVVLNHFVVCADSSIFCVAVARQHAKNRCALFSGCRSEKVEKKKNITRCYRSSRAWCHIHSIQRFMGTAGSPTVGKKRTPVPKKSARNRKEGSAMEVKELIRQVFYLRCSRSSTVPSASCRLWLSWLASGSHPRWRSWRYRCTPGSRASSRWRWRWSWGWRRRRPPRWLIKSGQLGRTMPWRLITCGSSTDA